MAGSLSIHAIHSLKNSVNSDLLIIHNNPCFRQIPGITLPIFLQKKWPENTFILPPDSPKQGIKKGGHIRKTVKKPEKIRSPPQPGVAGSLSIHAIHPLKKFVNDDLLIVRNPLDFRQIPGITAVIFLQKKWHENTFILPPDSPKQGIKMGGHIRETVKKPEKIRSPPQPGVAGSLLRYVIHPLKIVVNSDPLIILSNPCFRQMMGITAFNLPVKKPGRRYAHSVLRFPNAVNQKG